MMVSLAAAMAENRVIGDRGSIPRKIPGEQKIFKDLTLGKAVVMGRKTYESIGRALPGRTTIVVTRQPDLELPGIVTANSLDAALSLAGSISEEVIVAGGAELYAQALSAADKVYLTTVRKTCDDAFFSVIPNEEFTCVSSRDIDAAIPYTFAVYERSKHNTRFHTGACGADELSR